MNKGAAPDISRSGQLRTLRLLLAGGLLFMAGAMALGGHYLASSFENIERADALQKAAQLYQVVDSDLRQLAIGNRDYAEWDDAARFVVTRDPQFVAANFTRETLSNLHVDLVWVVGADGTQLYSGWFDRRTQMLASPASPTLLAQLQRFAKPDATLRNRAAADRIVQTSAGLMAISAIEITRTDHSGPTGAVLLFGRLIGQAEIERVRATSQLDFTVTALAAPGAAASAIPAQARTWATGTTQSNINAWPRGNDEIDAGALLRDVDHRPVAILITPLSRNAYALGRQVTWGMLGGIAALLGIFVVALLTLLERLRGSLAAFESTQARLRRISGQVQELIVLADSGSLRIVDANDALLGRLGCDLARLREMQLADLYPNLELGELTTTGSDTASLPRQLTTLNPSSGASIPMEITVTRFREEDRKLLCVVGSDITHRQEAEQKQRENQRKLEHLARHDPLTGLPNRLYLHAKLPRLIRTAAIRGHIVAVMYLDVDNFKQVNDSCGHSAGDRLLQVVAARLRAAVNGQDIVARIGGDEFVIVAAQLPDLAAADGLALRLQAAVQGPIVIGDDAVEVSASIGIALYPDHGLDMEAILKHADIALYQAKGAGKRCHRVFSLEMNLQASEQLALELALRRAIGTPQIHLDYQPIIDMNTGLVASLEALVRWRHPELGPIPPAQFIPAAEKSDLILELGRSLLEMVVNDLRDWLDNGVPMVPVAVNVSACQLERTDFSALVAQLAGAQGIDRKWLSFEITETVLLSRPDRVVNTLRELRAAGSKVLIDDFGVGYSSLNYLNQLPVDTLKIDQSFVKDIVIDSTRRPIVQAIIDMAHSLGHKTVAEGIESPEQLVILTSLGCDYAQGYFLSRPIAARQCRAMLLQLSEPRALTETIMTRALASA